MSESQTQTSPPPPSSRGRRSLLFRLLRAAGVLAILLYIGDFGYSLYASWKHDAWETTVQRDENGVMNGCEAFSVGEGDTAIILLHGINDTPYSFQTMAGALAERNFHVRAMRMPGFGEPTEAYGAKNAEDWIASIEQEAHTLRQQHKRVFIVAHSLGGAVTIQTLLREGEKQNELFDGVVLLVPAIEVSSRRSPLLKTQKWHEISQVLFFTKFTFSPFPPDVQDPELRDMPNRIPVTPRSILNETFRMIDANRNRESEITLPVLLVLTDKDMVNDHAASAKWFENIASEKKQLIWNNRSGHQLLCDLGWEEVVAAIDDFVQEAR